MIVYPTFMMERTWVILWYDGMYRQQFTASRNVFNNLKYDTRTYTLTGDGTSSGLDQLNTYYLSVMGAFITTGFHVVKNRHIWLT